MNSLLNIHNYDTYIISFSGGKDSTACFLWLLEQGVPLHKIELWHKNIDGDNSQFFDWEVTPDYCRKLAEAFGVKIYFQWKSGGFKRELLRNNSLTAPICFEASEGGINEVGGTRGKLSTRLKFPQQSPDLKVRWCSSYLKIDVCATSIRNEERFNNQRTLVISGERGEESPQRAKYKIFEADKSDARNSNKKRHVDRLRPIRDWKEQQVWDIIKRHRIRVHPCYYMGWNRCSCKFCVFSGRNQFASAAYISPEQIKDIIRLEKEFGCTINRKCDLTTLIKSGTVYSGITAELARIALSHIYTLSIIMLDDEEWFLPAGAFGENCGST